MIPSCPDCGKPLAEDHTHDSQTQAAATFYNPDPDDPDEANR